jgi:hypothetical protein
MFRNRFRDHDSQPRPNGGEQVPGPLAPPRQILPTATLENIYQAAAARAVRDHKLDRLFNPDYYGDEGSGI